MRSAGPGSGREGRRWCAAFLELDGPVGPALLDEVRRDAVVKEAQLTCGPHDVFLLLEGGMDDIGRRLLALGDPVQDAGPSLRIREARHYLLDDVWEAARIAPLQPSSVDGLVLVSLRPDADPARVLQGLRWKLAPGLCYAARVADRRRLLLRLRADDKLRFDRLVLHDIQGMEGVEATQTSVLMDLPTGAAPEGRESGIAQGILRVLAGGAGPPGSAVAVATLQGMFAHRFHERSVYHGLRSLVKRGLVEPGEEGGVRLTKEGLAAAGRSEREPAASRSSLRSRTSLRIAEHVLANPGCHVSDVARELGESPRVVYYHCRRLLDARMLTRGSSRMVLHPTPRLREALDDRARASPPASNADVHQP